MKKLLLLLLLPFTMLAQGPNCIPTTIVINLDQYQGETSWEIIDTAGVVVASGNNDRNKKSG